MMFLQVQHLSFKLPHFLLFAMIAFMSHQAFAATGTVTVTNPSPITVMPNTTFNIQGTYLLSSDTTPTGAIDPASGICQAWGNNVSGTYSPTYHPSFKWYSIHGYVYYDIDGVRKGTLARLQTDAWGNTSLGSLGNYNLPINTAGMSLGNHTLTVYLQDQYSKRCFRGSEQPITGDIVAAQTLNFTILGATPPSLNITLNKAEVFGCETLTGTATVVDAEAKGGTGSLTLPDGSTLPLNYAGGGGTFPISYPVSGPAGAALNFSGSVTSSAGVSSNQAIATANVVAGGLTVSVTPTKTMLSPFINNSRRGVHQPNSQTGIISVEYKTPVDISVQCGNAPAQGAQVSVSANILAGSETYGGHDHGAIDGSNKPTGTLSPASGATDTQGMFISTYQASEFSGQDEITATATYRGISATSPPSTITIQYPNLVPITLPAGSAHSFVGGTCQHYGGYTPWRPNKTVACGGAAGNSNQYISPDITGTFYKLLNEYSKVNQGAGLFINDASLEFGGMFDVNGGWHTGSNHSTHRIGVDVDFALKDTSAPIGLPTANPNAVEHFYDLLDKNKALKDSISFQLHPTASSANHIHIWFKK